MFEAIIGEVFENIEPFTGRDVPVSLFLDFSENPGFDQSPSVIRQDAQIKQENGCNQRQRVGFAMKRNQGGFFVGYLLLDQLSRGGKFQYSLRCCYMEVGPIKDTQENLGSNVDLGASWV